MGKLFVTLFAFLPACLSDWRQPGGRQSGRLAPHDAHFVRSGVKDVTAFWPRWRGMPGCLRPDAPVRTSRVTQRPRGRLAPSSVAEGDALSRHTMSGLNARSYCRTVMCNPIQNRQLVNIK
jgi:hypothetical protein